MLKPTEVKIFKAIASFVQSLNAIVPEQHSLALYNRFIEKTEEVESGDVMLKHITAFRDFCIPNRQQILDNDKNLSVAKVVYTKKVFIDIKDILSKVDQENETTIWSHLLLISAMTDPESTARKVLKNKKNPPNLVDFMSTISQISSSIMPVVEKLMESEEVKQLQETIKESGIMDNFQNMMDSENMAGLMSQVKNSGVDIGGLLGTLENSIGADVLESFGKKFENFRLEN